MAERRSGQRSGAWWTLLLFVLVLAIGIVVPSASSGNSKVAICHMGKQTLHVDDSAVESHLAHGDTVGKCDDGDEEPGDDGDEEPGGDGDQEPGDGGGDDGDEEPGSDPPSPPNDEGTDNSQVNRAGYCLDGTFYNLVAGQHLTDPRYAGATEAKIGHRGNPEALYCETPTTGPESAETTQGEVLGGVSTLNEEPVINEGDGEGQDGAAEEGGATRSVTGATEPAPVGGVAAGSGGTANTEGGIPVALIGIALGLGGAGGAAFFMRRRFPT